MERNRTKAEVADLIERFLENRLTHPQEWNDFVECRAPDPSVDVYRKRCYDLDPLVNRPDPIDEDAVTELRVIIMNYGRAFACEASGRRRILLHQIHPTFSATC